MTDLGGWLDETAVMPADPLKPLVTLSWAQSLDGSLTEYRGRPTALSGDESSRSTHLIRSRHDAVLVGILTVLSDDPLLTVRHVDGNDPRPVVLDGSLRLPADCRLLTEKRDPIVLTNRPSRRRVSLEQRGAEVEVLPPGPGDRGVDLPAALEHLSRRGVRSVMVEGGGEIIRAFLHSALWDRLAVTVAPRVVEGYGYAGRADSPGESIPPLSDVRWWVAGDDVFLLAKRRRT